MYNYAMFFHKLHVVTSLDMWTKQKNKHTVIQPVTGPGNDTSQLQ